MPRDSTNWGRKCRTRDHASLLRNRTESVAHPTPLTSRLKGQGCEGAEGQTAFWGWETKCSNAAGSCQPEPYRTAWGEKRWQQVLPRDQILRRVHGEEAETQSNQEIGRWAGVWPWKPQCPQLGQGPECPSWDRSGQLGPTRAFKP